jgi:hypothetical protein
METEELENGAQKDMAGINVSLIIGFDTRSGQILEVYWQACQVTRTERVTPAFPLHPLTRAKSKNFQNRNIPKPDGRFASPVVRCCIYSSTQ